jgi:hypothetical protein
MKYSPCLKHTLPLEKRVCYDLGHKPDNFMFSGKKWHSGE